MSGSSLPVRLTESSDIRTLYNTLARLEAVLAAQQDIASSPPDPSELLTRVVTWARRLTGADSAVVGRPEVAPDGRRVLRCLASTGTTAMVGTTMPVDGSLSGVALLTGETLITDDAANDERVWHDPDLAVPVQSGVVVPLVQNGNVVAVLTVMAHRTRAFAPDDAEVLGRIGELVRARLEHAAALTALQASEAELRAIESRQRMILGALTEGVITQDDEGFILDCNRAAERILGLTTPELMGDMTIHPDWGLVTSEGEPWPSGEHPALAAVNTAQPQPPQRFGVHRPDGSLSWVEITAIPFAGALPGQPAVMSTLVDVTERVAAEAQLQSASAHTEQLLIASRRLQACASVTEVLRSLLGLSRDLFEADGVAVWSIRPGTAPGDVERFELPVVGLPTGIEHVARTGTPLFLARPDGFQPALVDGAVPPESLLYLPIVAETETLAVVLAAWRMQRPFMPTHMDRSALLLSTEAGRALARLHALEALATEAETDALTGLANRRRLVTALTAFPAGGAVVLLDLDHFKALNDQQGHPAGDDALRRFSRALEEVVREDDTVARWGGEEFCVALPHAGVDEASAVMARLRELWKGGPVTFSAGITVRRSGESPDAAIARADAALYSAKRDGRDRVVVAAEDRA